MGQVGVKGRLILAVVAVLVVGITTLTPASAQYVGGAPPAAGSAARPSVEAQGKSSAVNVQVGRTTRRPRGLALTGTDIAQMVLVGGAFVVGGAALVRQGRSRVTPRAS